jgi:transaldolase
VRIFVDTASLTEIEEWTKHPWVDGFTTNPTLMRAGIEGVPYGAMQWAKRVALLTDKPVSIDGPPDVWDLGPNVWRKMTRMPRARRGHLNHTAIVMPSQLAPRALYRPDDIVSVFAGRIMDTGRYPAHVIAAAQETGALVLWASVREPYNIVQAEQAGCDIVTVPPAILRKYLDWHGKPLETVAAETIAQFERDAEGLW